MADVPNSEIMPYSEIQVQVLENYAQDIKRSILGRLVTYFVFLLFFAPYLLLLRLVMVPLFIWPPLWRRAAAWYLRVYFRTYFKVRGVIAASIRDLPKQNTEKPLLILTLRQDSLSALYSYQLFPFPLALPLSRTLLRPFSIRFPFLSLRRLFKTISYVDQDMAVSMPNIQDLLQAGYPTVAYINHHYVNPIQYRLVPLYKELMTLIHSDAEIYFLKLEGFSRLPMSHLFSPQWITSNCIHKDTLLMRAAMDNEMDVCMRIAQFFGFSQYRVM